MSPTGPGEAGLVGVSLVNGKPGDRSESVFFLLCCVRETDLRREG